MHLLHRVGLRIGHFAIQIFPFHAVHVPHIAPHLFRGGARISFVLACVQDLWFVMLSAATVSMMPSFFEMQIVIKIG